MRLQMLPGQWQAASKQSRAGVSIPATSHWLCLQAQCAGLQLDDRSRYTVLPPRVWGLIPRLAAQMRIEKGRAIFSQEADQGLMLSMELLDCEATGFQDEPGNFICRSAVPQKRVTTRATCTRRFQRKMRSAL